MALAWNAGWVNSPQGFKSPILRPRFGVRLVERPGRTPNIEGTSHRGTNWTQGGVCGAGSRSPGTRLSWSWCGALLLLRTATVVRADGRLDSGVRQADAHRRRAAHRPRRTSIVFTLLRTRKPEFGTPQLALSLRFWSIVLHVLAGVLIVGARHRRDLAQPRQCWAVVVRHLRRRSCDGSVGRARLLPRVRGRNATATAQTHQAQVEDHPPRTRQVGRRGSFRRGGRRRRGRNP